MVPKNIVTINWLMLPTKVRAIALSRFPCFIYSMRPKYSPDPLGVFIATDTLKPDKIALKAVRKEIFCMCPISTRHFIASQLQLASIKIITSMAFHPYSPYKDTFICCRECFQSCWLTILRYIEKAKKMNKTGPRK